MNDRKLTHIAGTFLIQADAAFLNGAGLGEGEDRNVTIPKTFRDGVGNSVPYVSTQAWKRWMRNTLVEETGWPISEPKAIGWNPKGNVNKIAAELNPIEYPEDDIFGYMRAEKGQGQRESPEADESEAADEEKTGGRTKSLLRASPFVASVLISLRSKGWEGKDLGFVHLKKYDPQALAEVEVERFLTAIDKKLAKKENAWDAWQKFDPESAKSAKKYAEAGDLDSLRALLSEKAPGKEIKFVENPCSPVPYTTRFYNTDLQGIFCLDYKRLGLYWNLGDRIELDEIIAKKLIKEGKIQDITAQEPYKTLSDNGKIGKVYQITDKVIPSAKERAQELFKALAVLRGGAKQAQFGTDVSPKVLILAGLTCGNPIFNHLFEDSPEGPVLKIATFKEIIVDYADRIATNVLIGVRSGYLKNEDEIRKLNNVAITSMIDSDKKMKIEIQESPTQKNDTKVLFNIQVITPIEAASKIGDFLK